MPREVLVVCFALAGGLLWSLGAQAVDSDVARGLHQSKGCINCHAPKERKVGPSHAEIADRYTLDDVPQLVAKVRQGGSGSWGNIPMIPHPRLSEEDIEIIVRWILAGH
ncbi:MAG: c-type cytochrome [Ectothiorhodospiraceae bacterium]|nr:c-type cytochrome [Ectothiorhodospiraceae bacterium]